MASQKHCSCAHSNATQVGGSFPNWPYMFNRQMTGGEGLTPDQHDRARRVFEGPYLNLANLLSIADSYTKTPDDTMKAILDDSLQHAGCDVAKDIFFNSEQWADWGGHRYDDERDNLAIALVAKSMTKVKNFNFNNVTKSYESDQFWQNSIHGTDGIKMGKGLLAEDLMRRGMAYYNNYIDRQDWMRKLEDILSDEVYIIGTVIRQLNSEAALPAKMKFFMLQVYGSSKIDEIANKWKYYASEATVNGVLAFVHDENHLSFVQGWLENGPYDDKVRNACTRAFERRYQVKECIYTSVCYYITHLETTYGKTAAEWINVGYGPKKLGLRTGSGVSDNVTDHVIDDGGGGGDLPVPGCFLAGTMVLLDNNKEVTIEHLQENDNIVGWHGNVGLVSSEKAGVVLESDTMAFGINDDEPFFLACHPFWTQDGWRAVDPGTARKENKWLDVGRLTQGDYVRKIKSNDHGKIEYEWVKVEVIKGKTYPAGTQFYGVHTREGPRSYHANGYLVCQNYPEITIQTVVDGLKNVSFKEQKKVQEQLKKLHPSLSKIMGPGPAKAILALSERSIDRQLNPSTTDSERLYLQDLTLPRLSFTYQHEVLKVGSHSFPAEMAFLKGHLFLDDQHVPVTKFADKEHILWSRPIPGGMWEHGCIKLFGNHVSGTGFVGITSERNGTNSLQTANFSVGASKRSYTHFRSKEPTSGNAWIKLGALEVEQTHGHPTGKMSILPNMDVADDCDHSIHFDYDSNLNLLVDADLPPQIAEFVGHIQFHGMFNWDHSGFYGYCIIFDAEDPSFCGERYEWKGELKGVINSNELLDVARKECLKRSMHNVKPIKDEVVPAPMAHQMIKLADNELSLEELFLITPPHPEEVHDLAFTHLQKVMKYSMDDDDRENILGTTKPTLNTTEQECANTYAEFFGNRMANSYMLNALSGSDSLKHLFTEDDKNKLLYYWAGKDKKCLSHDSDYNLANHKLARLAYIEKIPRLQDYINSSKGGEQWAKELYDLITSEQKLTRYATILDPNSDTSKLQKQSMVLCCLTDKDRYENSDQNYASDFYSAVITKRLAMNCDYFNGNKDAQDNLIDFMGDVIKGLVNNVLACGDECSLTGNVLAAGVKGTGEILDEFRRQMTFIAQAFGISMDELRTKGVQHMADIAAEIIRAYFEKSGVQWSKFFQSVKEKLDQHPNLKIAYKGLRYFISFAFWAVQIASNITAFMSWDETPVAAKVYAVADTIRLGLEAFGEVGPKVLAAFDEACQNGNQTLNWIRQFSAAKRSEVVLIGYKSLVTDASSAVKGYKLTLNEAIGDAIADTKGNLTFTKERWGKLFRAADKLAKLAGIIGAVAGCVMMGFQIYSDFVNGASVTAKVLDIVQGAAFATCAIAGVAGFFTAAACIPVIGTIASIVGVIAMVIMWILGRDPPKPKSPAEKYVEGRGGDYLQGLHTPTQEWLDDYKKEHPDEFEDSE